MSLRHQAMTLIEVLLAVSVLAMIIAVPFTIDTGMTYRIQAESAQSQIGSALRRAQLYAQQGKNDLPWGVHFQSSSITVFAGTTYASRSQEFDDVIQYDGKKITISVTAGATDVIFAKTTGIPSASSTIVVSSASADAKSITFSSDGRITYN